MTMFVHHQMTLDDVTSPWRLMSPSGQRQDYDNTQIIYDKPRAMARAPPCVHKMNQPPLVWPRYVICCPIIPSGAVVMAKVAAILISRRSARLRCKARWSSLSTWPPDQSQGSLQAEMTGDGRQTRVCAVHPLLSSVMVHSLTINYPQHLSGGILRPLKAAHP